MVSKAESYYDIIDFEDDSKDFERENPLSSISASEAHEAAKSNLVNELAFRRGLDQEMAWNVWHQGYSNRFSKVFHAWYSNGRDSRHLTRMILDGEKPPEDYNLG